MMATIKFRVLALLIGITHIYALPRPPNTIFADERLEGQIFENINDFSESVAFSNSSSYRLPKTTRPINYDVHWTIDMENLKFSGKVDINLVATRTGVSEIVIHSNEINITKVELKLKNNANIIDTTYTEDITTHFLKIKLKSGTLQYNAQTGIIYSLYIEFNAALRNDMEGIYKSWFRNDMRNESVSWIASTQFQPTAARKAFPCYDEPSFKAEFDITITRPKGYRSWSSTKLINTITRTNRTYEDDIYSRTPIMSTYLLALVVAQYDIHNENGSKNYEVIARPAAIASKQGEYAYELGQNLTNTMSALTDIDYYSVSSNLKMTHAAVPDFSAGAMENWGLITYREAYLMYDKQNTDDHFKQIIAYILSHEIAHMWFGNLVTNEFWDSLWLNEGFARYYQYYLTHMVEDYMGLDTRFIPEQVHTALLSDASNTPQPLTNPNVGSPGSVRNMFSTISYNKGAAVIRMTEHLLGTEVHNRGLRNYLKERSFGVAVPNDLFQALQAEAKSSGAISTYGEDFSVVDYYKSWTEQSGHPVLYVQINHQTGDMIIQQRRFNINNGYSTVGTHWIIPITFTSASNADFNNTKPSHIMTSAVTVINRGSIGNEWVIFNKQQTGFYRVNYDDYTWDLITIELRGPNRRRIHEYNRAQIVDDVFQFARSGIMTYTRAFNILSFLENETDYAPWAAAVPSLNWLRNRLAGTAHLSKLEDVIRRWSKNVMTQLSYEPKPDDTFMRSYLRSRLGPLVCNVNTPECLTAARNQLNALVTNNIQVPVNNRNWVYCNGLRNGDETGSKYDHLWNRYLQHNVYTEKIQILQVLGCTPNANKLDDLLKYIIDENFTIREQDYSAAFNGALTGNEGNTQIVLNFIQKNIRDVNKAFRSSSHPLISVAARLRSEAEIERFVTWVDQNKEALGDAYDHIRSSTQPTRDSFNWVKSVIEDMDNYFVNGDINVTSTPAAPSTTSTLSPVTAPPLTHPSTPVLPDSAATTFVSIFAVIFAVAANIAI